MEVERRSLGNRRQLRVPDVIAIRDGHGNESKTLLADLVQAVSVNGFPGEHPTESI